jgi:hypothetical protein
MRHEYRVVHLASAEKTSLERILNDMAGEGWLLDKVTHDVEGRPVFLVLMRVV